MKKKLLVIIGILLAIGIHAYAAGIVPDANGIVYVKKGSTGNGSSWTNAVAELSTALWEAKTNTAIRQIWIAGGTYYPQYSTAALTTGRDATFMLVSGIQLYGGFAGTETTVGQRNPDDPANTTVLSGNIGDPAINTDNCYRVVQAKNLSSSPVIDGFTITGGYANYLSNDPVNPSLNAVQDGAAIYLNTSDLQLNNTIFTDNYALRLGGAICAEINSHIVLNKVVFNNNNAQSGGAFFGGSYCEIELNDVSFLGNYCVQFGGACNIGSAISARLNRVVCRGNYATGANSNGGAILVTSMTGAVLFNDVLITGNSAQNGGGVYAIAASLKLTNVTISGNKAGSQGGGVYYNNNSNSAYTLSVNNSVIAGNSSNLVRAGTGNTPIIRNSLISGTTSTGAPDNNLSGTTTLPAFVNAPSYTTAPFLGGDYHLQSSSPLINAGSNSLYLSAGTATDLDGNSRVYNYSSNGIIDIGAYEYTPVTISPDANGAVYVKKGAAGNGSSWVNAVGEVADALLAAGSNTAIRQIWVAGGTYYPKYNISGMAVNDRNQTFMLVNGVKLYGGFNGSETDTGQRNLSNTSNAAILSGDVGTIGTKTDNCYHVLLGYNLSADTELDGFTVTGGYGNGIDGFTPAGETVAITRYTGAGMWMNKSDIKLRNLVVTGNECNSPSYSLSSSGAGIYFAGASHPAGTNLNIRNNIAGGNAAGFYLGSGSVELEQVSFVNNSAYSGGALAVSSTSSCRISNAVFSVNSAIGSGGALLFSNSSGIVLSRLRVNGNDAGNGGGIYFSGAFNQQAANTASLTDVVLTGNAAGSNGGAICMFRQGALLTNVTISGNNAGNLGGAVYMKDDDQVQTLGIHNSVLHGNSSELYIATTGFNADIGNSLIAGITTPGTEEHNLSGSLDPLFVNAPDNTFAPFPGGDYRVNAGSVLINSGDSTFYTQSYNSTDIAGNARIYHLANGGVIDIGAYESLTTQIPAGNISAGDIITSYASEQVNLAATSGTATPLSYVSGDTTVAIPYQDGQAGNAWKLRIKKAGVITVSAIQPADHYYETAQQPFQVTIKKQLLGVNPKDSTKTYDGQPFYTGNGVTYSGFVRDEDEQVLGGTLTYTGDAQGAVNAGDYMIQAAGLVSDNYDFDYGTAALTIKKAPLVVTARDSSLVYTGAAFTGGNGVTYNGFVNGENEQLLAGILSYSGDAQQAVNSGDYSITPSGLTAVNYDLTYTNGALHITPAPLTVTARDVTKQYDGIAFSQGGGLSFSGFVNAETEQVVTGTPVYGGNAQGAVNAGDYTLSVTGLGARNYQLSYVAGILTIEKVSLTAAARDTSKTYDGLNFTGGNGVIYSGFVNGEDERVLLGTVNYAGEAQGAVNAGAYNITASGITADNYTVDFKPGKLIIAKALLTVTARDTGKVYNGQPYYNGNGVTYNGFMQSDNELVLKNQLLYTGSSQGAINAGDYIITPAGYTADNYELQYVSGKLTVAKAPLWVRPNDAARCYGVANPAFTLQYSGFVNGETEAVVAVKPVAATSANTAAPAGVYDITLTGGIAGNYALDLRKGVITVYALPESVLTAGQGTILCGGNASLPLTASGAYSFRWMRNGNIISGTDGALLTVNTTGSYTATAADSHGCQAPVGNEIVVTRQLPSTADFSFNGYCAGNNIQFSNLSQGAGNSSYTYQWQSGAGHTANTYNAAFSFANAGDYTVTLTVTPVGCASLVQSTTKQITIEQPIPGVSLPTRSAAAGAGIQLEARRLNRASYTWLPVSGLSDYTIANPTATLTSSQTYLVRMQFPSGCTTVDTLGVTVTNMAVVLVANVFSPNGDGINDVLLPNLRGVKQLRYFRVFNRAGKKLFESADASAGWDGRVQGILQPFDTYVWTAEGIDYNGNIIRNQGSATLLR